MVELPETVLSARLPQVGRFAVNYLAPGIDVDHDLFMMDAVRKDLTRNLGRIQPSIYQDISESIDELWGIDTDNWHEICLWETMQKMVFRSTNRVLVGLPLCQDEGYLRSSTAFANWLGAGAVVVGQYMPSVLKPFFGYLTAIPIYIEKKKSFGYLAPVFKERMENIRRKRADPNFKFDEPKDLITWMSTAVIDNPTTTHSKPEVLAQHLLFFVSADFPQASLTCQITDILLQALGAIHTTIITPTNTFLDLLSSDPELKYYEALQEEASTTFGEEGDWADPAALGKLPCADSTIRETLRKNPVLTRVSVREVVRKGGIDLPDGHHVPQGGWLAAPVVGIHHDERFYPDPEKYKPFRFAKAATETPSNGETDGSQTEKPAQNRRLQGLPVASDSYLPWGYGRHSW